MEDLNLKEPNTSLRLPDTGQEPLTLLSHLSLSLSLLCLHSKTTSITFHPIVELYLLVLGISTLTPTHNQPRGRLAQVPLIRAVVALESAVNKHSAVKGHRGREGVVIAIVFSFVRAPSGRSTRLGDSVDMV